MFLLETLDVKFTGLVGRLYAGHVVSADEAEDVSAEATLFRANEKLLSVLSRKSPQQFQLFLDALDDCGQRHVRDVITDRRPGKVVSVFTHVGVATVICVCVCARVGLCRNTLLGMSHTVLRL